MADAAKRISHVQNIFMEEKFNESTINRPEGERLLDGPFVIADVPAYIKQITSEDAWFKNDRNAITLFKGDNVTVVLIALHEGAQIQPPTPSAGVAVVQLLSGELTVEIEGQAFTLTRNQLLTFHEQLQYYMAAREESILLLTMYNKD
jgi:quercetin dioxygenase-like cupin family protein